MQPSTEQHLVPESLACTMMSAEREMLGLAQQTALSVTLSEACYTSLP